MRYKPTFYLLTYLLTYLMEFGPNHEICAMPAPANQPLPTLIIQFIHFIVVEA